MGLLLTSDGSDVEVVGGVFFDYHSGVLEENVDCIQGAVDWQQLPSGLHDFCNAAGDFCVCAWSFFQKHSVFVHGQVADRAIHL